MIWFVGVLAPTSSFLPVRDGMAEHRLYLAFAGLLLATASVSRAAAGDVAAGPGGGDGCVLVLAVGTYRAQSRPGRDPMPLWEEAVRRSPGAWQAHWGYAGNCSARSASAAVPSPNTRPY